jgi:trans-aconitate methyltransferase
MASDQGGIPSVVDMLKIDGSVPHSARVWNYLVGGKDWFESDRQAAEQICAALPVLGDVARYGREFLVRAMRYLAGEAGLRQFLDIGTGVPTANNTHEVAQSIAPDSRIVYVDNDPIVLAHARSLLTSTTEGATDYIDADVHDPDTILREAARTLDFSQPVGLMLIGIMNFVVDDDKARAIVARLRDAVVPGSYLTIQHPASEDAGMVECIRRWNQVGKDPLTHRTKAAVSAYFEGMELIEPGVVTLNEWRPDGTTPATVVPSYAAMGRKP